MLKEQTAVSTKGMTQGDRLKVLKSMGQIHQNNNQNHLPKSSQRSKVENASTINNHRENSKTVNYSSSGNNNPNFDNEEDLSNDKRPVRSTRRNHTAHTIKAISGYGTDTSKQSYKNWFGGLETIFS